MPPSTSTSAGHRLTVRALQAQGASAPLAARRYQAGERETRADRLLVFFHGGGFFEGGLEESDAFLRALALAHPSLVVLAASYTLAGAAPFPAAIDDAHAVLSWAGRQRAALGWSGRQLVVAGIEAGAHLAAVASLMARDRGGPALAGQILIMPMLDPSLSSASMRAAPAAAAQQQAALSCARAYRAYLPHAADRCHPYAAPLQASRLKNLAPALILPGDNDPLRDEAELYATRLIAQGVRTSVMRLQTGSLDDSGARVACAAQAQTLHEIGAFLDLICTPSL